MSDAEAVAEAIAEAGVSTYVDVVHLLDDDHGRARTALRALEATGEVIWRANGLIYPARRASHP